MQYFQSKKLAFFHMPKTAGRSFRLFLQKEIGNGVRFNKANNRHEPISDKAIVMGQKLFNETNVITIIRNPYDVVVSYYAWINSPYFIENGKLKEEIEKRRPRLKEACGLPFDKLVDWFIKNQKCYSDYLLIDGKIPQNLYIIRFERLIHDANLVLNQKLNLNIKIKLPHKHKTKHKHYIEYYNDRSIEKVTDKYKWTFDNFPDYQRLKQEA